ANLADGQIAITGEAGTSDAYGHVIANLAKLPDGASLGKIAIQPPEVKPFVWGVERDNGRVRLTGNAPMPAVRSDLGDAAKKTFPNNQLSDQMAWGRGAPANFGALTDFAFAELAKLADGKVGVSDNRISIDGSAPSSAAYEQVLADLKRLPNQATLAAAHIL